MNPPTQPAPPPITPEQLREARTALGWSPYFLAHLSRVTISFIYCFEKTGRVAPLRCRPRDFDALAMVRKTLEAAGVEFIGENGFGAKGASTREHDMTGAKDYAAIFGNNFRAARLRAGLKITEVSKRTGLDLGKVALIEHGGLWVTIQSMGLLAEAVGCPLSTLLEEEIDLVEVEVDQPA